MVYRLAILLIALVAAVVGFDIVLQGSDCARLSWSRDSAAEKDNPVYTCWTNEAWDRELSGGSWPGPPWGAGLLGLGGLLGAASGPPLLRQLAYLASPRRRSRAAEREAARRRNDRMVTWVTTTRRTSRVLGSSDVAAPTDAGTAAPAVQTTIPRASTSAVPATRDAATAGANGTSGRNGTTPGAGVLVERHEARGGTTIGDPGDHDAGDTEDLRDLDDAQDADDASDAGETAALLAKLQALRDDGIITDDIYELKRKALLER